jgi:hypothetical protein
MNEIGVENKKPIKVCALSKQLFNGIQNSLGLQPGGKRSPSVFWLSISKKCRHAGLIAMHRLAIVFVYVL